MNDSFRVPAKDTGKGRQIDPVRQPTGQINDGLLDYSGDLTTESGLQICSFYIKGVLFTNAFNIKKPARDRNFFLINRTNQNQLLLFSFAAFYNCIRKCFNDLLNLISHFIISQINIMC